VRYFYISPPFLSLEHFYTCPWIHFLNFLPILFFKLIFFNPNLLTLITLCHLHILNMPYSKIHTIPPSSMNGECVHTNKSHPHHLLWLFFMEYSWNIWKNIQKILRFFKNIIMSRFVLFFFHFQIFSSRYTSFFSS
jgi:hypothetical protein